MQAKSTKPTSIRPNRPPNVAQALLPAASPLMGTLLARHRARPATPVETSLDTAGTSACATAVLSRNCIPESGAKVVEGRAARWVIDQITAAQPIERQVHGLRAGDPHPLQIAR